MCTIFMASVSPYERVGQDPEPLNLKSTYNKFHPFQHINGTVLFSDVGLWCTCGGHSLPPG